MIRAVTSLCTLALTLSLAPQVSAVSYLEDAQPIFAAKCGTCHTTSSSGGHAIGTNYADGQLDSYYCDGLSKAACCLERIEGGTMPLGRDCNGPVADDADNSDVCVTESEFDVLAAWITEGALETNEMSDGSDAMDSDGACSNPTFSTKTACEEAGHVWNDGTDAGPDEGPSNGTTGVGDGYTYEEGSCQAGGGSLGWLMLLLAGLSLVATRRRRVLSSLR